MDHIAAIKAARSKQKRQAAALEVASIAVYDAIRAAAEVHRQRELVEASGFNREHIRRIVNSDHGTVPPRSPKRP